MEQVKDIFRNITLKAPQHKKDLEKVLDKWQYIKNTLEVLSSLEIVLNGIDEEAVTISEFESKVSFSKELPSTQKALEVMHDDLQDLQSAVGRHQMKMDQLKDDFDNAKIMLMIRRQLAFVEKSNPNQRGRHFDIEPLDKEIQKLNNRWNNVCAQLADRMNDCEQAYALLKNNNKAKEHEDAWLDGQHGRLKNRAPLKESDKDLLEATRNLNSVVERASVIERSNEKIQKRRFKKKGFDYV